MSEGIRNQMTGYAWHDQIWLRGLVKLVKAKAVGKENS